MVFSFLVLAIVKSTVRIPTNKSGWIGTRKVQGSYEIVELRGRREPRGWRHRLVQDFSSDGAKIIGFQGVWGVWKFACSVVRAGDPSPGDF